MSNTFDTVVTNAASGGALFATDQYVDGADTVNMQVTAVVFGPQGGPYSIVSSSDPLPTDLKTVGGTAITLGEKVKASSLPVVLASDQTVAVSATGLPLPSGAATESTLSLVAKEGSAVSGTSLPSGSSVLGWLSYIWKAITDRLPTTLVGGRLDVNVGTTVGLTDAQLRNSAVPVSGTFYQATQPVSLASVPSHAVTNAGTFAVQAAQAGAWSVSLPSGAATLTEQQTQTTALQLLDDVIKTAGSAVGSVGTVVSGSDGTNARLISVNSSGHVNVVGGLTDAELRASAVPISVASIPSHNVTNAGTFAVQAAQTGVWSVNLPTGASTLAEQQTQSGYLQTLNLPVGASASTIPTRSILVGGSDGTNLRSFSTTSAGLLNVADGGGSLTVDGTFWQATQPVSIASTVGVTGPLTDVELRASAVPVSLSSVPSHDVTNAGTFAVQASQSGSWAIALPSGASTLAEQQTQTTSLQLLDNVVNTVNSSVGTVGSMVLGSDGTNTRFISTTSSGSVNISDAGGSLTVDGPLTDAELRASAVPISVASIPSHNVTNIGTFAVQAAQSGAWTVGLPSGAATLAEQQSQTTALQLLDDVIATGGSAALTKGTQVAGTDGTNARILSTTASGLLNVADGGGSLTVDGTFWQATQPVSIASTVTVTGGLTDTELRASAVPVSLASVPSHAVTNAGTFATQAAQSGTWNITNVSGTISLPTGAAIASKQPTLGSAGTASTDVITIQGISGMTALKTDGTATTQPISAASLPLPSGASTAAKQPSLGTAGVASADVLSVQGVTSMTPLKTDGSGVTQPVSGTVGISGTVTTTGLTDTELRATAVPVSLSSVPSHNVTNAGTFATQSAQSGTWTVQPGNTPNTSPWLASIHDGTTKAEVVPLTGYNASAVAVVDSSGNQITSFGSGVQYTEDAPSAGAESLTLAGAVRRDSAVSSSGADGDYSTINTDASGRLWTHVGTIDGGTITTVTNVVHVDDNSGSLTVDQSGTWTVQHGNTANTTPWLASVHDGTTKAEVVPLAGYNALAVGIVDASGNQVTSFGGGTQYTEDGVSAGGESLTLAGAVRRDTAASSSNTDGDYSTINTDSTGRLWTHVGTIDGGTITTVSTVTNLSQMAGTAIAMNTGVRSAGTQRVTIATDDLVLVSGNVASASADSGNPVKVGGVYNSTSPSLSTGQRVDLQVDGGGRLKITTEQPVATSANWTSATTATVNIPTGGCSSVFFLWSSSGTPPTVIFRVGQNTTTAYSAPLVYDAYNNTFISSTVSLNGAGMVQIPTFGAAYVLVQISVPLVSFHTTDVYYGASPSPLPIGINKISGTVTVDTELPTAVALANGATVPTAPIIGAAEMVYNGSTLDFVQGKEAGTAITAGAYTATQFSSVFTARTARGIMIYLNVSSVPGVIGTNSLTIYLRAKNPMNSGNSRDWFIAATPVTTTGTFIYEISGDSVTAPAGGGQRVQGTLPLLFDIAVSHANTGSFTYSVTYHYVK